MYLQVGEIGEWKVIVAKELDDEDERHSAVSDVESDGNTSDISDATESMDKVEDGKRESSY